MRRLRPIFLLGAVALAGCTEAPPPTGQALADRETRTACERRAEDVYNQQNRADIYSPSAPVNTPFSANYVPGVSDRGLSQLFARDRMVSDCVRNTGTQPIGAPKPR